MSNEKRTYRYINSFKIGADPEFSVYDSEKALVNVEELLGFDGEELGADHGGKCAEIRPKPARSAFLLVRRMRDILLGAPKKLQEQALWKSGAIAKYSSPYGERTLTLGGHVHFDILAEDANLEETLWEDEEDERPEERIALYVRLTTLDRYTDWLERLDILPRDESGIRRMRGEYGKWSDYRIGGSDGHLEYRTMCSWLFSPKAAMLALTGAKISAAKPNEAKEYLEAYVPSRKYLKGFFERFQEMDDDARRLVEKLDFEKYKSMPEMDFREHWQEIGL